MLKNNLFQRRRWLVIPVASIGGLLLGVIARLWMRWISTDPEFSWGGTIGITLIFGIFFSVQATVYLFVSPHRKRWSVALMRFFGVFFSLPLFVAAGSVMFPVVLTAVLALWRTDWFKSLRLVLATISIGWAAFISYSEIIDKFGWSLATVGRITLMVAIYALIIRALKATVGPRP